MAGLYDLRKCFKDRLAALEAQVATLGEEVFASGEDAIIRYGSLCRDKLVSCRPIGPIQSSPCCRIFLCKSLLVSRHGSSRSVKQVILQGSS